MGRLKQSYECLKEYFSSSQKLDAKCNPAQLVVFAEHAAKVGQGTGRDLIFKHPRSIQNGDKDIAADCLRVYFGLSPPSNQFYIRAHLCDALITSSANEVCIKWPWLVSSGTLGV